MAPSLSNAKLLATPLADALSQLSIYRRVVGYAVAAAPRGAGGDKEVSGGEKKSTSTHDHQVEKTAVVREHSVSTSTAWGPDPVTGYYRPAGDRAAAIEPAELRDVALNHNEIKQQI